MQGLGTCVVIALLVDVMSAVERGPFITCLNRSNGDITQLHQIAMVTTMYNALPPSSRLKWNYIKDYDGKYVIPYAFGGSYENAEKEIIRRAMAKVDKNTCIRFHTRSYEKDYVEIQNHEGEGCFSTVGRYGGKSILMLEASRMGSCMQEHTIIHELLHIVGLWHEHMREDRDKYIVVHWDNIQKGYQNQFAMVEKSDAVTYGLPYDYLSIMHYGKTAFANPRSISMEPMEKQYLDLIGKAKEPSENDWIKVCAIYECKTCMGRRIKQENYIQASATTRRPAFQQPSTSCIDKDLLNCYFMDKNGTLDCAKYKHLCCGTCIALAKLAKYGRAPFKTSKA
ncbi:unnamed protein product [Cylicocyclus nassatus]|uniref:Metalloendopeptidase n=1 Tax=Cylicocyclus nassatus TaxID=53992 RepID=A0AA36GPU8_CYLNA|nr:unnamed protein product [Cylicocyclus nassatus]